MKTSWVSGIILSLAWSLSAAGLPPEGKFRLTVNQVVATGHCRVLTLKIEARAAAEMMAMRFPEGRGGMSCILGGTLKGKGREGEVVLAAIRTSSESAVETTTVLQTSGQGSHTSSGVSYDLGPDAEARGIFSLSITNGLYDLNRPLVIGKRNGETMRLVVGRWNWETLSKK